MLDDIPNAYHQELGCGEGCKALTKRCVIIHRFFLDNDNRWLGRLDPQVIINALYDDVLLEIFHFCVDEEFDLRHQDEWLKLVLKVERLRHAKFGPFIPLVRHRRLHRAYLPLASFWYQQQPRHYWGHQRITLGGATKFSSLFLESLEEVVARRCEHCSTRA